MKETINYKITETKEIEKTFECDVKNVFLSFYKSGYTCYFGSFEYEDKSYTDFNDSSRIIQITLSKDNIEYNSTTRHAQGLHFAIKHIFEDYKNVKEISREMFMKQIDYLPLSKINL